jgi:hypothetical protein
MKVAPLAIARSIAPLANQMEGRMPEPLKRSHIKREAAQARAYSQAVITEGGRTIWLAGQVAIEDSSGRCSPPISTAIASVRMKLPRL